ncbi:hypothetical protein vseg_015265 [Gypsophila vaccaria]
MESYQPPHHGYFTPPPSAAPPPPTFDPQYHHHRHQYPPPPPPPQHNDWGPPPPPPPPPQAYSTHPHQCYLPSSYSNQEWGNGNWTHSSGWEYPAAHINEEDWAAKAKAWASARIDLVNQQPHSQYTSAAHQENPSHYANQYPKPIESHFQDTQQTAVPAAGSLSYQGPVAPLHWPPAFHQQEPTAVSSYESHLSYAAKDVVPGGDSSAGFAHFQGQTNSSAHQQEVPSSYSSIQGKEHGTSFLPASDRARSEDNAQFAYGNHSLHPMDQPLDFASRFSHGHDPKISYPDSSVLVRGTDSAAGVSSMHSWTAPVEPGAPYPPMAPAFPSALQHDHHIGVPPLPGQHSPMFGTGPGFQPPFTARVDMSAGAAPHPAAAFSVDAYGVSLNSERPKKAAVPNWLREEIIKTKGTIVSSAPEQFKEGSQSIEDELIDKPIGKDDQADSKSMDSARSTEEDDEDEEDAHKTSAINQEIKRVLTEVLLKVTDELFNEIATKVLSEDDHSANAIAILDDSIPVPVAPLPPPPVSLPKASAKVIIPAKAKMSEERASGETSSESAGNILGLANYASDEDDEIQASSKHKLNSRGARDVGENARRQMEAQDHEKIQAYTEIDNGNGKPIGVLAEGSVPAHKFGDHRISKDLPNSNDFTANSGSTVSMDKKCDGPIEDAAKDTDNSLKETLSGPDVPIEKLNVRMRGNDEPSESGAKRPDRLDGKKSSSARDNHKEKESRKEREAGKDESYSRREERHNKKDKKEDSKREGERDRKERSSGHHEKARESDSRKRSHREDKDRKYDRERDRKNSKDDADKKRVRIKEEKNDKSRHKSSDLGRHKRTHSSSVNSPSKRIKDSPIISSGSSDEVSEDRDSRRKHHAQKRNMSPSPVRSGRRDRRSRSPVRQHRR